MSNAGRAALLAADAETALAAFSEAVAQDPRDYEARYGLAAALMQAGEPAHEAFDDARTLQALSIARGAGADMNRLMADAKYARQIGVQLYNQQHVACASVVMGMALSKGEIDPLGLLDYALSLQHQARGEEAAQYMAAAVQNFPSAAMHNYLAYAQLFCDDGERRYAEEARAWAARWAAIPPPPAHANPPLAGRKLRVGYVAPKFADSQLRQFITPILEAHDPDAVEVVLYPTEAETETGWPAWVAVRALGNLDDAKAAELIRNDRIDVLNDCWGHTSGSRLGVFARKPAPVQVAWINFFHTTGLPQMDYVIQGAAEQAPDFSELFTEKLWPIGPVYSPFRPAAGRLEPVATPAKASGTVTFGSFNHPGKLSDGALAAWATVLRNAPRSRLLLKYRYYMDPVLQSFTRARFLAHGVAPDRIVFAGHSAGEDYFKAFQEVDLMLDSWPYTGSTTTLEALSNGVPVLLMTERPATIGGYYGATMLRACGLPDLITETPEDFVARALELARDVEALDAVRARVRPGFDGSALRDEMGFVRRLEDGFRAMFAQWQAEQSPPLAVAAG
ncbi:hypothetical protein ACO2Q0_04915 [Phenylobacterium sp. VNQ135]|uniref:O-linked N-acetylglucosamine transferase, SPINDLY family protein n=1 Tax=Phenylobacterium sp. VNQ135 TaxID=3400922 RepID=UPI003C029EA4